MKRLFKSSLALFLSVLLLVMSTVVPAKATLIGDLITDPSLESALNETLDDSTVVEDVYSIDTTGTVNTYWIEDLTGLEVFINLESLTIDSQTVIDLAPLAGMENLTTLKLGGGSVDLVNPVDQRILYYICDRGGIVTAANFDCSSNMDSWVPSFPEGSTLTDPRVYNDGDTYVSFYWEDVGVASAFDVVGYHVFVSSNPNELGIEVAYVEAAGSNYTRFGLDAMEIYPMDSNLYVTIHAEMDDPNVYAVLKDQIALSLALSMAHDKDYIEVNESDVVTISVFAENIRSLYDADISLNFDPQLFQLQEVRKGAVYGEQDVYIEEPVDPAYSPLNVKLWGVNELVLSGAEPVELLQLDFKAISSPGTGYFELGPTSVMAGNENYLEYSPYSGSVSTTVETLTLISSIVLSETSLYLDTLDQNSAQLDIIEILPETATYPKAITWSSTNENVVTVDQTGFVTVVGQGVASIEVSADFGTAFASVDVEVVVPIDSIDIVQEELFLQVDETQMLDYLILPIGANVVSLKWTTGDVNVATVDQYGYVTAVGSGTTEVIVTANGTAIDSVMVTVDETQILETPVLHKKLDNIVLTEGESVTIDLNDYITHANSDLLTYEFPETMVFSAELEAGQLQITGLNAGAEQVRFHSLDEGNTALRSASMTVTVQPAVQTFLIEAPIKNQYMMDGTQLRISLEDLFTQIPDDITVQVDQGYGILEAYILDGHIIIDAPKMYAFLDGDMDNYMESSMITLNAVSAEGEGISTAFMANVTSSMMYRSMMLSLGIIQEAGTPLNLQHVLALINQLQQGVEGQTTEHLMDINIDGVYDRRDMEQWLQLVRRTPFVPQLM